MLELWKHQRDGVSWLNKTPRALLADEPGLGKSAQLLLAAKEPVLIIAPAMVLDGGVWDDEIAKWTPGIDAVQTSWSSLAARGQTTNANGRKISVHTDKLRPEYDRKWATVIADEAHYAKNRKAHWTKAFEKLKTDRLFLATGTPIPNWANELYVLAKLLHPGDRDFRAYWPWAQKWFDCAPTRFSPMVVGDLKREHTWEDFFQENLGDKFLMRYRDDVLDLPPLTIKPMKVKMGAKQAQVYKELKKDFITWLESGTEIVAWNSGAQLVKLCKAATGLEILEQGAGHSAKLDALKELLTERDRPTLVVGHFRDTVAACARVAIALGKKTDLLDGGVPQNRRGEIVRDFQSSKTQVLVATIDTIREGLTLTSADQVIRVERSWRPSSNEQVVRRLHRIGQDRPVSCVDLITDGTVDLRVLDLLKAKTDQQMAILGKNDLRELV